MTLLPGSLPGEKLPLGGVTLERYFWDCGKKWLTFHSTITSFLHYLSVLPVSSLKITYTAIRDHSIYPSGQVVSLLCSAIPVFHQTHFSWKRKTSARWWELTWIPCSITCQGVVCWLFGHGHEVLVRCINATRISEVRCLHAFVQTLIVLCPGFLLLDGVTALPSQYCCENKHI